MGIGTAVTEELQPLEPEGDAFPGFLIPESYSGVLDLRLGRPAREHEPYAVTSDAYAPGEPLSCRGVYGARANQLDSLVPAAVTVRIQPYVDGAPVGAPLTPDDIHGSEYAHFLATDALALSETEVLIHVTESGESPFLVPVSPGAGRCLE